MRRGVRAVEGLAPAQRDGVRAWRLGGARGCEQQRGQPHVPSHVLRSVLQPPAERRARDVGRGGARVRQEASQASRPAVLRRGRHGRDVRGIHPRMRGGDGQAEGGPRQARQQGNIRAFQRASPALQRPRPVREGSGIHPGERGLPRDGISGFTSWRGPALQCAARVHGRAEQRRRVRGNRRRNAHPGARRQAHPECRCMDEPAADNASRTPSAEFGHPERVLGTLRDAARGCDEGAAVVLLPQAGPQQA
mmetsp:Transcript_11256/g.28513  ORF Transcript_11256/g.28513 Transcript_11256/m.28513 type:complete len:250 (-) Transcript_11256:940-1689(-)